MKNIELISQKILYINYACHLRNCSCQHYTLRRRQNFNKVILFKKILIIQKMGKDDKNFKIIAVKRLFKITNVIVIIVLQDTSIKFKKISSPTFKTSIIKVDQDSRSPQEYLAAEKLLQENIDFLVI